MWTTYKELYEYRLATREDGPIFNVLFQGNQEFVERALSGWNQYNTNAIFRRISDQKIVGWTEQNRIENSDGSKVWYVGARAIHPEFRDGGATQRSLNEEALYYIFNVWGAKAVYAPVFRGRNNSGTRYNWESRVPTSVSSFTTQSDNYGFVAITREDYFGN